MTEDIVVRDSPDYARYEAWIGDTLAAFSPYRLATGDQIVFSHTETEPGFEGRGAASALTRFALDDARRRGLSVVPHCQFMAGWIERHPEYGDVVAG
jgi:predicted GNAT family acetyltransferase